MTKTQIVNLAAEDPIVKYDMAYVNKILEKLNSGKEVNSKIIIRLIHQMLYQMQYISSYQNRIHFVKEDLKQIQDDMDKLIFPEMKK